MLNTNHAPAFPGQRFTNDSDQNLTAPNGQVVAPGHSVELPGMALRDYFAAKYLQGFLASPDFEKEYGKLSRKDVAELAYKMSDAMMEARER
jgi:hypothetical protein